MKRILLGICGAGYGHINRQRLIIERLINYNVILVLAVPNFRKTYFEKLFPDVKVVSYFSPWVVFNESGVDFEKTKKQYSNDKVDYYYEFLEFSERVEEAFDYRKPDYVMTDYERNVAQYSYAVNKPLISLDQHSKFLALPTKNINNVSIERDTNMLNYFFPKVDKRFVSSFFPIKDSEEYNIEAIPPIVRDIRRSNIDKKKIVIYFSTYSSNEKMHIDILDLVKNLDDFQFKIYTECDFSEYSQFKHLQFYEISDEFHKDLADCCLIISSAGHQLISEAINAEIPLYLFSLDTFDQNYCCHIVEKYSLGRGFSSYDREEFYDVIKNLSVYSNAMIAYKKEHWTSKWDEVLFKKLEQFINM